MAVTKIDTITLYVPILSDSSSIYCGTSVRKDKEQTKEDFIPERIVYSGNHTICFFKDGSKTISRPSKDEEYSRDVGVMACIVKKMFGSRNQFLKLVESGYEQPKKEK